MNWFRLWTSCRRCSKQQGLNRLKVCLEPNSNRYFDPAQPTGGPTISPSITRMRPRRITFRSDVFAATLQAHRKPDARYDSPRLRHHDREAASQQPRAGLRRKFGPERSDRCCPSRSQGSLRVDAPAVTLSAVRLAGRSSQSSAILPKTPITRRYLRTCRNDSISGVAKPMIRCLTQRSSAG